MPLNLRASLRALATALLLTASLAAHAQAISTKLYFTGGAPYTDEELSTVVGLHSGQLFNDNELQAGSQRLIDTGLFDSAALTATGKGPTRQARYTLKATPPEKLLGASFENFVWFTPAELDTALRDRVPLYRGLLPDSGNLPDSVQTALTALLKEKGIAATLSHTIVEPTTQHPLRAVNFRIETPAVRFGDAHLSISGPPGAAAQLAPLLKETLTRSVGNHYNEGLTGFNLDDRILSPVRNAGYIASSLDVTARTAAQVSNGYAVTVTARIVTGDVYHLSAIAWEPTPVYAAADLTRDAKLHPGDLVSAKSLDETEAPVLAAYRKLGYMDAYLRVTPTLDASAHTVAYALAAVPGEPYQLNTVAAVGLGPAQQKAFDANWAMKHGDPYSEAYVANFLHNNTALRQFDGLAATFTASADPNTHLVDLTITFVPVPRAR
jgi:outer membrane protein insertion porin family